MQYPQSQRNNNNCSVIGTRQLQSTQDVLKAAFKNIYIQEFDYGQFERHTDYLHSIGLLSPRHIKYAALSHDFSFFNRDSTWADFSVFQKLTYLFDLVRELEFQNLKLRRTTSKIYMNDSKCSNDIDESGSGGTLPPNVVSQQSKINIQYQDMQQQIQKGKSREE